MQPLRFHIQDPCQPENFKSYLAGLIKEDGCIVVPTVMRNPNGKKRYAFIRICFYKNDYPLAEKLQILIILLEGICNGVKIVNMQH